jgi:hypothetical protein
MREVKMEAKVLIMTAPVNRVVSLSGCSQWIGNADGFGLGPNEGLSW